MRIKIVFEGRNTLPASSISIAVTGYLGKAFAKDSTPSLFVLDVRPTNNSRPVNRTSPPSINAGSVISMIFKPERQL